MPTLPDRLYDFCTVNFSNRLYSDPPSSQSFLPVISLPKHSLEIHSILVPLGRSDQQNSRFSKESGSLIDQEDGCFPLFRARGARSETITICMSFAKSMISWTGSCRPNRHHVRLRGRVTKICVTPVRTTQRAGSRPKPRFEHRRARGMAAQTIALQYPHGRLKACRSASPFQSFRVDPLRPVYPRPTGVR